MTAGEIADWSESLWGWSDGVGSWRTYTHEERRQLAQAALDCVSASGVIVEIGCYGGLTAGVLLQVCRKRYARFVGCDSFGWNGREARKYLQSTLLQFPDVQWDFYPQTSIVTHDTVLNNKSVSAVDFLHIDGDHLKVDQDCELWLPLLVPGGCVAFHDANPNNDQGRKVIEDAERFTGWWPTIYRSLKDNCLMIRRKI